MNGKEMHRARSWTDHLRGPLIGLVVGVGATLAIGRAWWSPADTPPETVGMPSGGAMASMEGMDPGDGEASVRLSPSEIREFGITFGSAEVRELEADVRAVGVVDVAESRVEEVVPRFSGFVERLHADFTGLRLREGDVLAEVYSPELVEAQEELLLARELQAVVNPASLPGVTSSGGLDLVAAARRRLELWNVEEPQIDSVLALGRPMRTLALFAPRDGIVLSKNVQEGAGFGPGETLFVLADLREVWMDVEVPEMDAWAVRIGTRADVHVPALPGETLHGRVDYVYPVMERATRSVRARIVISNPGERLLPGMYATVRLRTSTVETLSVPVDAIVRTGLREIVFVAGDDGVLRAVEVRTGRTLGDFTEVLGGLEEGARVVTSAQYLIDAEANIGAVMRSMMSMMGAGDMGGMDMGGMDMGGTDIGGMDMGGMDMGGTDMGGMDMDGTTGGSDSSGAAGRGR